MKILGLIPARGGSKGVPGKNKKILAGKPLLAHTIDTALQSKLLTDIIFSSEDEILMEIAKKAGAQVLFKRPQSLSKDDSSSIDVVMHTLKELNKLGKNYDAVCLLQVTNPFRTAQFIDEAILKFINEELDALVSVLEVPHQYNPHWVYEEGKDGVLKLATGEEYIIKRRQDLPKAYFRDGAIYITKSNIIIDDASLYGSRLGYILSSPDRHINIDSTKDWENAVRLANKLKL